MSIEGEKRPAGEKRIRNIKEAGKRRTIKYAGTVLGEDPAGKLKYMVQDLGFPTKRIAREIKIGDITLRRMLKAFEIETGENFREKDTREEMLDPAQSKIEEPVVNVQNLPIIDAVKKALEQGKLNKRRAAMLLWLYPYMGESPSLSMVGDEFEGVSRQAIQQSRGTALKTLEKSGLLK
ncbi:MAG: hypothetical protein Q7K55_01845 [Candidatus Levybacteria bacterium]|nr:hypothetical protein [Candidatus Levybacteria bacterium]